MSPLKPIGIDETSNLPARARQRIADNLTDPATVEGAALSATIEKDFARVPTYRGAYDPSQTYEPGEVVNARGASFFRLPSDLQPTTWALSRTNYITNPRFRENRAGWTVGSGITATISDDTARLTFTGEKLIAQSLLFAGERATVAGDVWSAAVTVKNEGAASVTVRLAMGMYPTVVNVGQVDVTIPAGATQTLKVEGATVPAGKTGVRPVLYAGATLPAGTLLVVSQPILEKAATVGAYFDGDSASTETVRCAWTGAPHNSASVLETATLGVDPAPGGPLWSLLGAAPAPTFRAAPTPFAPAAPARTVRYPATINAARTRVWSYQAAAFAMSDDDAATWTVIHTFEHPVRSARWLDNGEVIVSTRSTDNLQPHELWLSDGMGRDPSAATWTRVMTGETVGNGPVNGWSWSVVGPVIVVCDYGTKAGADNARHAYLSTDYGRTWKTIYDLGTVPGHHLHGAVYDKYWDRIWLTYGDDTSGIVYSDDLGETWSTAQVETAVNGPWQVVGGYALPDCVIFGSDGYPNGVVRISRVQGKRTPSGRYTLETAYALNADQNITHLCHYIYQAHDRAPVVLGFGPETQAGTSRVLVTHDGYDVHEIWADPEVTPAGRGVRVALGPTARGRLLLQADDAREGAGTTLWRGTFPAAY